MTEQEWVKILQIQTDERDDVLSDEYRYPYEPTPYCVLERLAESGLMGQGDRVLDYGCGKGRVSFFLSKQTGAQTVGIEYDARIYECALKNNKTAHAKAEFVLARAEDYAVPSTVNRCYFLTPFPRSFSTRSWREFWSPITSTHGKCFCSSITPRTSTFPA